MFKTQFNPDYKGKPYEVKDKVSLTEPDMTLTIQELLINHTRSIPSDVHQYEPQYFDEEIPRFDDPTEEAEYKQNLMDRYNALESELKEQADLQEQERQNKALEEAKKQVMDEYLQKQKKGSQNE